ncbi:MAG TPA: copper homeostasis protein CutC [Terracidiphilus sp.]|nr:copper homeostasis protein CutC [Terracidiphilus sp.]
MKAMLFELCAENLASALAAQEGGADRIELCAGLAVGGLTPPSQAMTEVVHALDIPVHVLIRPRPGSFVFSNSEFDAMRQQIDAVKRAGASGIATGILLPNGCVDIERTRALIDQARPMDVTFHRAFDEAVDLSQALEDVIEAGADSLLTSGGAPNVLAGASAIRALAEQAGDRIPLIAGGGLRLETLAEVIRISGIFCMHGSLSRRNGNGAAHALVEDVREAVRVLRVYAAELAPPAAAH